ncbi:MAG: hypothetical protein LBI67_02515 [Treponema sp.]|jgi:hypothetical protein|nr:hypothetical protein [Treponema sp.]
MNYKRKQAIWVLGFVFFFSALLQAQSAPKDIIVLVDTSSSMSSFYANVTNYLTGPFLEENLNLGDTFHLISFSGRPRFEIARRVIDLGDVQTINGRIFLLYPLEPVSDISSAIDYGERYTTVIPANRQKKIFVVSDSDVESVRDLISASSARLQNSGTTIRYLKVPFSASTGTARISPTSGNAAPAPGRGTGPAGTVPAGTGSPAATAGDSGQEAVSASPAIPPASDAPADLRETPGGGLPEAVVVVPGGAAPGGTTGESPGGTGGSFDERETAGTSTAGADFGGFVSSLPLPVLIAIGVLILLVFGFIIVMMVRNLSSSPGRVMASATGIDQSAARNAELLNSFASSNKAASRSNPHRRYNRDDPNQFLSGPSMLNLFVEDQNTAIGRRNVHTLKAGSKYTVGGGGSDFLIFLVPIPPKIGELRFDGTNCTFIPLKSKYFPDIESRQVPECIGKVIRIISDKNYELFFHFERYRDPLIALNQLLHSINVPEK